MRKPVNPTSSGFFAGLLFLAGCGGDMVQKPPVMDKVDLSRPFGNPAPPPVRQTKKTIRPGDDFVPKNPKLARERRG